MAFSFSSLRASLLCLLAHLLLCCFGDLFDSVYVPVGNTVFINCTDITSGTTQIPHWSINGSFSQSPSFLPTVFPDLQIQYLNRQLIITNISQNYNGISIQCSLPQRNRNILGTKHTLFVTTDIPAKPVIRVSGNRTVCFESNPEIQTFGVLVVLISRSMTQILNDTFNMCQCIDLNISVILLQSYCAVLEINVTASNEFGSSMSHIHATLNDTTEITECPTENCCEENMSSTMATDYTTTTTLDENSSKSLELFGSILATVFMLYISLCYFL